MSDDRPKKSWREIDAQRDRNSSRGVGAAREDQPLGGDKKGVQRQRSYRAQLDRLFASGGIGKLVAQAEKQKQDEAAALVLPAPAAPPSASAAAPSPGVTDDSRVKRLAAVRDAIGPEQITKAINAFVKAHGWCDDLDLLSAALEHRDDDAVREALGRLGRTLAAGKPRRAATLAGRLRTLEELSSDHEIRRLAADLRRKL
jgi:hypothetical protein